MESFIVIFIYLNMKSAAQFTEYTAHCKVYALFLFAMSLLPRYKDLMNIKLQEF